MLPLLHQDQEQAIALAQEAIGNFYRRYSAAWLTGMKPKLGLADSIDNGAAMSLTDDLFIFRQEGRLDYTSFFRSPGTVARGDAGSAHPMFPGSATFVDWVGHWRAVNPDADLMDWANPVYVPRNHLVEEALTAAVDGDLEPFAQLQVAVTEPFRERPDLERYAAPAPETFACYQTFCGT